MQRVLAKLDMIGKSKLWRKTCYFCKESCVWLCACKVPKSDVFEYEGTVIMFPGIDLIGVDFVHPALYYGNAYYEWVRQYPAHYNRLLALKDLSL